MKIYSFHYHEKENVTFDRHAGNNEQYEYRLKDQLMKTLLYIALGGAIGSVCRYLLTKAIQHQWVGVFPWGTLVVNLIGCALIGLLYGLFEKHDILSSDLRLLLTVGLCGGFTTFSTFMNESLLLMRSGEALQSAFYIGGSVALGLLAVYLVQAAVR